MADSPGEPIAPQYEFELTPGRDAIAEVLNGVVDGIFTGAIRLGGRADAVTVGVPDDSSLQSEFEDEGDESSLELELERPAADIGSTGPSMHAADRSASLARFEVSPDRDEDRRWRLRHRNGNPIAISGEGYSRTLNAQKGLRSVIENASEAEITETPTN